MAGRRNRKRPTWCNEFIEALQAGLSVQRAAAKAGVSRALVYQRRETDETFRRAWDENKVDTFGPVRREPDSKARFNMRATETTIEAIEEASGLEGMRSSEWWRQAAREKLRADSGKSIKAAVGAVKHARKGAAGEDFQGRAEFSVPPVLFNLALDESERCDLSLAEWWRRAATEKIKRDRRWIAKLRRVDA